MRSTSTTAETTSRPVRLYPLLGWLVACGSTLAVVALLLNPSIPLGWLGEWVWNRSPSPPWPAPALVFPFLAGMIYLAVAILGGRWLARRSELWVGLLLPSLVLAGGLWHLGLLEGNHSGLGMERWIPALHYSASSGYLHVAGDIKDSHGFLTGYEAWVRGADNFHLGTHPPGLILLSRWGLDLAENYPAFMDGLEKISPARLRDGFELVNAPLGKAEQGALLFLALATWFCSLLTAPALYGLVRVGSGKITAWWAAALWPAVPASLLFVPIGDSIYPLIAVVVVWWAMASYRVRLSLLAMAAGVLTWLGMMTSLAFVVTGVLAAGSIVWMGLFDRELRRTAVTLLAFLAGWALPTVVLLQTHDLNMIEVWRINLAKHAGFYQAMPRSYFPWLLINILEFAVMMSPAAFLSALYWALAKGARTNVLAIDRLLFVWILLLMALDASGRNRSEAARLWLFLVPFGLIGACRFVEEKLPRGFDGWGAPAVMTLAMIVHAAALGWVEPLLPVALAP